MNLESYIVGKVDKNPSNPTYSVSVLFGTLGVHISLFSL